MDLDLTPPLNTTLEPGGGVAPRTLLAEYKDFADFELHQDAIHERLEKDRVGLTLGVLHVTYSYRVARENTSWHYHKCHLKYHFDDNHYSSAFMHNLQPAWVPRQEWDSVCPMPLCNNTVSHVKSAAECGNCAEKLVLNQDLIHDHSLTVATEPKTLHQRASH